MEVILKRTAFAAFVTICLLFSIYTGRTAQSSPQTESSPRSNPDASALFAKNCASCHGKDGQAKTFKAKFNHARNLTDPEWQVKVSDERLFNSISNGKGKMPAWGKKFSEAEIDALVTYVRSLKG